MIRAMVQFTEQQMRRLKQKAASDKVSVSEVVRRSVERGLKGADELTRAEKWRRATAIIGKYRSGLHDLAAEHDKYFVEAIMASHKGRKK